MPSGEYVRGPCRKPVAYFFACQRIGGRFADFAERVAILVMEQLVLPVDLEDGVLP